MSNTGIRLEEPTHADASEFEGICYLGEVQKLELTETDLVVVYTPEMISDDTAKRIQDFVKGKLPGNEVIVLGGGFKIGVISPKVAA